MGKTEVEDALERLDMLTKEENLMTVARTFKATHEVNEVTQHVDTKVTVIEEVVQQVDGNVRATQDNVVEIQELTHHVDGNVMEIQELAYDIKEGTCTINDNVKVTKDGARIFQFLHTRTDHSLLFVKSNG
jgi:peptidoglycan hydrolase CwlO-like protein